jgi:hypothetical protein
MLMSFWSAPLNEEVDQIRVLRAFSLAGPYSALDVIAARDPYDNWVTHYIDMEDPLMHMGSVVSTAFYKAQYLVDGQGVAESPPEEGVVPYQSQPKHVLDLMQGLPFNFCDARLINYWIEAGIAEVESTISMKLTPTRIEKEIYDYKTYQKIVGVQRGRKIQLRHRPITGDGDIKIYYRIRGAAVTGSEQEWTNLDAMVEYNGNPNGYNPGVISVYPRTLHMAYPGGVMFYEGIYKQTIAVLISYTHGFAVWPRDIEQAVTMYAAAQMMEVTGQAETAGLGSRSIDGYSESFTASATTTQFSALRIAYMDQVKATLKRWQKPRMA